MDDDAFGRLNHYLDSLKLHFSKDGDTGREIVDDIEQRIAELLENRPVGGKQSVTLQDVNDIITTLGKVEDFSFSTSDEETFSDEYDRKDNRRLYRHPENYYLGGVAGGLGDYFNIDPLWIRIAFVLLFFLKGFGLLIYLLLWIVVPKARTTAEKLQMKGKPVNLSTIKDSVNEEYERLRMTHHSSDSRGRNVIENIMRAFGIIILALFKILIVFAGILLLIMGSVFLAGLVFMVLGLTNTFGYFPGWHGPELPNLMEFFGSTSHFYIALTAMVIVFFIPIMALIYGGIKILFNIRSKHPVLRAFILTSWILALILFVTMVIINIPNSRIEAEAFNSSVIETGNNKYMVVDAYDNLANKRTIRYSVLGYDFTHSKWDDRLYNDAVLKISLSKDDQMHLDINKKIKNIHSDHAYWYSDRVDYNWSVNDSLISLDRLFHTDEEDFWLFPRVEADLSVPEGFGIVITRKTCEILVAEQKALYCGDSSIVDKKTKMSPEGTLLVIQ